MSHPALLKRAGIYTQRLAGAGLAEPASITDQRQEGIE
ncbi:Uncharacterised protein [Bordetella ansorpii]|uniref:Uncharacterized protein n=1 Tax=Bordetella ansorpii TaxID=288768 RepID=A0A157R896_9BORD|nr:Uncharacterised protein [Bordetella ansorpii]